MMSKIAIPSMLLLLLSSTTFVHADPGERVRKIAPYLDEQTIAVLYFDIDRSDVPETLRQLAELVPSLQIRNQIHANVAKSRAAIAALKEAEAELFVVFSSFDLLMPGPYAIVSMKQGADPQKILNAFKEHHPEACEPWNDVIYTGSAAALKRIKNGIPAARPRFAQAFAAAGDAPTQLVIAPSSDHRRVIREMLPRLPEALGGGSSLAIADLEWAAAGITPAEQLQVDMTTQSPSDDSALALKSTIGSVCFSLTRDANVRQSFPNIDLLLNSIVPRTEGNQLKLRVSAADANVKQLLAALSTPLEQAQASRHRQQCTTNLKHLALGMHNYHSVHKTFPSAASHDPDGKPLLSWRVHLLPYLEQRELYAQFHLDEPWDSAHNKTLIRQMPDIFACPGASLARGRTTYLLPTGPHAVFKMSAGTRLRDIVDGTSNTIMIVDASPERAVVWTKPQDIEIDPERPIDGVGGQHEKAFATAFCDGSVRHIPDDISLKMLRWLLDPNDGNLIPQF